MKGELNMNKLHLAKIGSVLLSLGGSLLTIYITSKDNEQTLQKLVDEKLKK